eukprot:GHVN01065130.1.p1 GENE.GHVN01065130.1~~GHVN01065130.1.p1  ORF type:complete len:287 (+),score=39.67 GHVN01065130.1:71-931(+)
MAGGLKSFLSSIKTGYNRVIVKQFNAGQLVEQFATNISRKRINSVPRLNYKHVTFLSLDGIILRAWYIPSTSLVAKNRIVIFNHFFGGNKAGTIPGENGWWEKIKVDFMPIYNHLTSSGYDVFTYDMRNHGESDSDTKSQNGLADVGFEDAVASVRYVKEKFPNRHVYLYGQCCGAVAMMKGMKHHPVDYEDVRAFINIQPLSADAFLTGCSRKYKFESEGNLELFAERLKKLTSRDIDELRVPNISSTVTTPTMLVQVRQDWRTTEQDINNIFASLGTKDKKCCG